MNLILVAGPPATTVVLTGRQARHAREVLRVAVGRELRVGVIRGPRGAGRVVALDGESVTLACRFEDGAGAPPWLDVVLAMPRPKVLARVLETLAAFGARRIDLVNAWRVDKSFFGSHRIDDGALREALLLGCEQGGHTWLPEVEVHPLLVPFLEGELAARLDGEPGRRRLLAHPAAPGLENAAVGAATPVVIAIGPEGGWIASELSSFAGLGFTPVALGPAVLRVEPAVAALVGQLWLWRRLV